MTSRRSWQMRDVPQQDDVDAVPLDLAPVRARRRRRPLHDGEVVAEVRASLR